MLAIGTVLGETYRLERLLGEGGMGAVYEAAHLRLERRFAIKVLVPEIAHHEVALQRFEREARVTSSLGHPHIVEVIDFNRSADGYPYLVMERLEGESLAERLARRGLLELGEVSSILRQATSALAAAHERGIIHRDLKPENIYLCRRGALDDYVKLLDFGISKVLGAKTVVTNVLVGSPSYMSPEQADERAEEIDAGTDIYSLATVAFEMLTGQVPFTAQSIPSLLYKVTHDPPPSLCELRPELPPALDEVLQVALRKARGERYPSMAAFWEALAAALEREAVAYVERTEIHHTAWPSAPGPPELEAPEEATVPRAEPATIELETLPRAEAAEAPGEPHALAVTALRAPPRVRAARRTLALGLAGGALLLSAGLVLVLVLALRDESGPAPEPAGALRDAQRPVLAPDRGSVLAAVRPDAAQPEAGAPRDRSVAPARDAATPSHGELRIVAPPAVTVYVEGALRTTRRLRLRPGSYTVTLALPGTGLSRKRTVVIRAGSTRELRW